MKAAPLFQTTELFLYAQVPVSPIAVDLSPDRFRRSGTGLEEITSFIWFTKEK